MVKTFVQIVLSRKAGNRRHHCLQTLFLLFKFVTSETKEYFVSRTNALLVGTLISIGEVSVSITIKKNSSVER